MTVTILIATNHAGLQLVQTVQSIRHSHGMSEVPIHILADTLPVSPTVSRSLQNLHVSITWQKTQSSQADKLNQLLKHCQSSHVILTQDDVLFDPNTLQSVVDVFEIAPTITFVGVKNIPLPPRTFMERVIGIGTHISNTAARSYRGGDNYLACTGRIMAFPTPWIKHIPIPPAVIALDAYLYFQNAAKGGHYRCLFHAPIFFRSPNTITEHVAKGDRFRNIPHEMQELGVPVSPTDFQISHTALLRGIVAAFATDALATAIYGLLMIFLKAVPMQTTITSAWSADMSTKDLGA